MAGKQDRCPQPRTVNRFKDRFTSAGYPAHDHKSQVSPTGKETEGFDQPGDILSGLGSSTGQQKFALADSMLQFDSPNQAGLVHPIKLRPDSRSNDRDPFPGHPI